jgi:hypothetical protein
MNIHCNPRLMIQNPIFSPCLEFPRLFSCLSILLRVFGLKPRVVMIKLYGICGSSVRRSAIATIQRLDQVRAASCAVTRSTYLGLNGA